MRFNCAILLVLISGMSNACYTRVRCPDVLGPISTLVERGIVLGMKRREMSLSMYYTNRCGETRCRTSIRRLYETQFPWLLIPSYQVRRSDKYVVIEETYEWPYILNETLLKNWDTVTNSFDFPFSRSNLASVGSFCSTYDDPRQRTDVDVYETDAGRYRFYQNGMEYGYDILSSPKNAHVIEMVVGLWPAAGGILPICNTVNENEFYNKYHAQNCEKHLRVKVTALNSIKTRRFIIPASSKWLRIFDGNFTAMTNRLDEACHFRLLAEAQYSICENRESAVVPHMFRLYGMFDGAGCCFTVVEGGIERVYKLLLKWGFHEHEGNRDLNHDEIVVSDYAWIRDRDHLSVLGISKSGMSVMAERSLAFGDPSFQDAIRVGAFNCVSWTLPFATNMPSSFRANAIDDKLLSWRGIFYYYCSPHFFLCPEIFRIPIPNLTK